jgi:hypothetical protein
MRKPLSVMAALLVAALSVPRIVQADSAADKATAREVATEGISLFQAGKYADALDRLQRAQALYDAPVHLLYIARSQEKLGSLVEASETYRLLDRYLLPAGASEAWVAAVDDGRKELAVLEPRVPKLRIMVAPKDAPDASVQIDGAPVSAAVIGIPRAVNPGAHHVVVAAKGYAPAEANVETKEGETKDVALTLTAAPAAADVPAATSGAAPAPGTTHSFVGFLAGLRLGGGIPTGTIWHFHATPTDAGRDINVSDAFQPGGSLELHAGVRFGRYFTPVLYIEGETLSGGDRFFDRKVTKAGHSSGGLGVLIGTPPGKIGGFGEFDLVFVDQFSLSADSKAVGRCDVTAKGAALRFGGGAVLPLASWFQLTPFAMATIGRFTKIGGSGGCEELLGKEDVKLNVGDLSSGDVRTHTMIVLGVGGDIVLGKNR